MPYNPAEIWDREGLSDIKRLALRAKYRAGLEQRLGKAMEDWYLILTMFDPEGQRTQYELSDYLRTSYSLAMWEANVLVYYYLRPDRRFEIGRIAAAAKPQTPMEEKKSAGVL